MDRSELIARYAEGPAVVDIALAGITEAELDRRADPTAWTAREIAHHLADSEANSYVRLRKLLAEESPTIVGYDQDVWAKALDYAERPIEPSLAVFRAVRAASSDLLSRLDQAAFVRSGTHTESGAYSVDTWLEIYAAHAHDHAAQISSARAGGS
jgi:hypothetical protein